jgi:DNA polymerase III delta prime subunit
MLLVGPEGVGKKRIAHLMAHATGVSGPDFQNHGFLTKTKAREMIQHHSHHPLTSEVKTSIVDLSGASPESQHALLKLLEEPPEYSRIILHSDTPVLLTIRSRCFNVPFGLLTEAEVTEVLSRLRVPEHAISEAARLSGGRVSVALDYVANLGSKKHVEDILRALGEQDASKVAYALSEALEGVESRAAVLRLMERSLRASLSDSTHVLSNIPLEVRWAALSTLCSAARPVLKVRSACTILLGE